MPLPFNVPESRTPVSKALTLMLKTGTPILGGGVMARQLVDFEPIRVASIRGQLRFWWRATTDDAESANALFAREQELWGGVDSQAGKNNGGKRSAVRVMVDQCKNQTPDKAPIDLSNIDSYALWPAREPLAPRWKPGLSFRLRVTFPRSAEVEVRQALAAWICFGGYGSRTRRGLGQLVPDCQESRQLVPKAASRESVLDLFPDFFTPVAQLKDWPRLREMYMAIGAPNENCLKAWHNSLEWLRGFRQGEPSRGNLGDYDPSFARVRGANNRPSVSNWPEADKVRQLSPGVFGHTPRHNQQPAWPKAAFGLPVISQFQRNDRNRQGIREPENFEIVWQDNTGLRDRLASPLILGAVPTAGDSDDQTIRFVPFAAWLARGYPRGNVVARQGRRELRGSQAPFDLLVAPNDQARFQPLETGQHAAAGTRMRTAFFSWLKQRYPNVQHLKPEE